MRFLLLLCLVSTAALAQDIPLPPTVPDLAGVPSLDAAPAQFALVVLQLAQGGRFGAAALLALFAATYAFRKLGLALVPGKAGDFLRGKWGGWLLNLTLAVSGGFGSLAVLGLPVNAVSVISVVGGAITFALGSAGLNELVKDVIQAPAVAAGEAAAAKVQVMTKTDVVAEMAKGPPQ